ncbi:ChaN family lipoprotein [Amaricoccus tamworthensis]|uniref:ChaN family lipoprotein n=1 Tax=Amaricoccus tamworthensis TaxID=57002 RepID=UPI003C7B4CC3
MTKITPLAVCISCLSNAVFADETALEAFIGHAADAQIVVLGEVHDNPGHHENQARIVEELQPGALVFEMIDQEDEDLVNDLRKAGAGRAKLAEALDWENSGWPDFDYYAAILEAAPFARVFGAGQSPEDIRTAATEGAAKAFGVHSATYGLEQPFSEADQKLRELEMMESHCNALPEVMLPGMVEVQRFRDAGLADAALWARNHVGEDGRVVVITGSGHADARFGAPALMRLAEPEVSVLTLGQGEGPQPEDREFDAWMTAPAPDRDDPCDAFDDGGSTEVE